MDDGLRTGAGSAADDSGLEPVADFEVCDGYSVRLREGPVEHKVELTLRLNNEEVISRTVFRQPADVAGLACCRRAYWLWLAIAHFLNAGGNMDGVIAMLAYTHHVPLQPPEGYHLLDTLPNEHAFELFDHIFGDKHGQLLIWTEATGVNRCTATEFLNEQRGVEDEEG